MGNNLIRSMFFMVQKKVACL